jgi:hypothetical protein
MTTTGAAAEEEGHNEVRFIYKNKDLTGIYKKYFRLSD